jgi:methionyl-tRNA formyltransferase
MRILFFGSSDFAIPTFASILNDGHEIVSAVTQPDRQRGRGKRASPTPVKEYALEQGVPVAAPEDVNAADVVEHLKSLNADLAYVAAFGQKIGRELLDAFPVGIVNLHASLLPALRGAAPIQWAVINGEPETGVTVFRLVEKMDAGPILVQRRTQIGLDETADELHDRLARIGCDAVRVTLEMLQDDPDTPGTVQDESKVTKAPKLKKSDGHVTFDQPVREVALRICGLWSWPGATCRFVSADGARDEQVTLARAVPYEGKSEPAASPDAVGRVTEMMSVQCLDAELAVLQVKPAGGKLMDWRDFVNGRHVRAGDRFVPVKSRES